MWIRKPNHKQSCFKLVSLHKPGSKFQVDNLPFNTFWNHTLVRVLKLIYSFVYLCFFAAAPPVFLTDKYNEKLVLKQGDSVAMELPFNANPQPAVAWEFNHKPVSLSRRVTKDTIRNMTSLCLGHVVPTDAGTYTCKLENQYGKATMDIKVIW